MNQIAARWKRTYEAGCTATLSGDAVSVSDAQYSRSKIIKDKTEAAAPSMYIPKLKYTKFRANRFIDKKLVRSSSPSGGGDQNTWIL